MKKVLCVLLAGILMLGAFTACSGNAETAKETVYAVEAGSAGEEVAQEKGYKVNVVQSQADALMEVAAGTSDAAIIDLLMAGAMIGEGTSYPDLVYGERLTEEEYGVGCRKDSDLANYINAFFYEVQQDGSLDKIAMTYGVQKTLINMPETTFEATDDGDVAYIQGKGTLIVGITDFAPMDYEKDGEWIGFDADLAKKLAAKLGVEVKFVVIDWDNKIMELDGKSIDVVWNGMTLTDGVKAAMACSNPYCKNAQVVVTKKAA